MVEQLVRPVLALAVPTARVASAATLVWPVMVALVASASRVWTEPLPEIPVLRAVTVETAEPVALAVRVEPGPLRASTRSVATVVTPGPAVMVAAVSMVTRELLLESTVPTAVTVVPAAMAVTPVLVASPVLVEGLPLRAR
jgi:predicted short-subunit dehydrogenase-like oxidoreductase (DUF2520 family)